MKFVYDSNVKIKLGTSYICQGGGNDLPYRWVYKLKKALFYKWIYKLKITTQNEKYKERHLLKNKDLILKISFYLWSRRLCCVSSQLYLDKEDIKLVQVNVKITFLHNDLHDEMYVQQLKGFRVKVQSELGVQIEKESIWLKVGTKVAVAKL